MFKCQQCGQELPSADTHHTYEDCMKHELAEAIGALVKYKAWELARQVVDFVKANVEEA